MLENKLLFFLEKLLLGIILAAPIGPVSIEMIKRGIRNGFMAAFNIRLGGAIGNILCLLGAYFGLYHIMAYPLLINGLGLIGAGLLLYMGATTLLQKVDNISLKSESQIQNGLTWGIYLAIANPVALVFWPGIFAASIAEGRQISLLGLFANLLIVAGVLLWGAGLSLILSYGHKIVNERSIAIISRISGLFMLYYGCKYIWVIGEKLFCCI
ncbi:MAG: LysE family transporter [Pseudomonadota bacterium]